MTLDAVLRMLQELSVIAHGFDERLEGDIAQAIVKAKRRAVADTFRRPTRNQLTN